MSAPRQAQSGPVSWLVWVVGALVLVATGFAAAYLPRVRARATSGRTAWSAAHAAIDSATVSRDAAPRALPHADELLTRAELLAASGRGAAAAEEATDCATRADRLYREVGGE
jgi:uncharacterized protein DUF6403